MLLQWTQEGNERLFIKLRIGRICELRVYSYTENLALHTHTYSL